MTGKIVFIRHGQGEHNVNNAIHLHDPDMTELGKEQCRGLGETFPHLDRIKAFVASPLRRTIYTLLISLEQSLETFAKNRNGKKPIVDLWPDLQELSVGPCDTGSPCTKLVAEFGSLDAATFDFSKLEDDVWIDRRNPASDYTGAASKILVRARRVRRCLWDLAKNLDDDEYIAVVGHGGMIKLVAEDYNDTKLLNCEYRVYEFTGQVTADDAKIRLDDEHWARMFGDAPRPTEAENLELRYLFLRDWATYFGFSNDLERPDWGY